MPQFEDHGVRGGVWSGRLTAPQRPGRVCVVARGEVVAEARLTALSGEGWEVRVDLPGSVVTDGATSLIMAADDAAPDAPVGAESLRIGRLNLMAGKPLDEDLESEIAHLRAELELLKREFRRLARRD